MLICCKLVRFLVLLSLKLQSGCGFDGNLKTGEEKLMKKITKIFAFALAFLAAIVFSSQVFACDKCKISKKQAKTCEKAKIESYAHPTFFAKDVQVFVSTVDNEYVIGKVFKAKNRVGIKNKENVHIDANVKEILKAMKEKQCSDDKCALFDPKKPILRSELAFVLSEGLDIKASANGKKYPDVPSDYWAADWIAKAYDANLMIGYTDGFFRPSQKITKAEVFAVVAQMLGAKINSPSDVVYKNRNVEYIPTWAIGASKAVIASNLLEQLPDQSGIAESQYLSKEQVAYLIGSLRKNFSFYQRLSKGKNVVEIVKTPAPECLSIKLSDRLSARHSNIGDKFTAKTTKEVNIDGKVFPAGSKVTGEVIAVQRPGLNNPGFIRLRFIEISSDNNCAEFPKRISEAQADKIKNPNFIARLLGAPLSGTARILGVTFRTIGTTINVVGNDVEKFGDELSNAFVETASLKPVSGLKSFGSSFVTVGTGVYDICKLAVSGAFGVVYEVTDEIKYLILPSASNNSSLNPGEELIVIF